MTEEASAEEILNGAEQLHDLTAINERNIKRCAEQIEEYNSLQSTLSDLLKKRKHSVLVPVGGGIGYFEGELVHTNDVLVLLGDNWWANTSVFHAKEVASRRIQFLQREQKVLAEERKRLTDQRAVFSQAAIGSTSSLVSSHTSNSRPSPPGASPVTLTSLNQEEAPSEIVIDPEDELTTEEMIALENELGDRLDDDDYVEKVLLDRMLEKRAKREASAASAAAVQPPFVTPSDIGKGFLSPPVVIAAPSGCVGEVVERTQPTATKQTMPARESLFRKSQH
jgi:prefoldin alpha subunit